MSNLQRAIRNKRYMIKDPSSVALIVSTEQGETLKLNVIDCSTNGLRGTISKNLIKIDDIEIGSLMTASKIVWKDQEVGLGRIVLRRIIEADGDNLEFAFSTVDMQVPVSGHFSKQFEMTLKNNNTINEKEMSAERFNLSHFVENEYSNVDLFDRLREFSYFHNDWASQKKYAYYTIKKPSIGPRVNLVRQRKSGRSDYLLMGSNDYLGLGSHPEVVEAARNALDKYGFGSTGSPVTTGLSDIHDELCQKIARIHHKEAAILYNSGYAANVGALSSVCVSNDLIVTDQLCHASIQDGMAMSKATSRFFKHNNIEHLKHILSKERENYNGCLVVTEGIFSMDGDTAKLDEIYKVAREYNCRVFVDQAHCFGVVGPNSLGICDKFGLFKEVDIIMGTFSKIGGGIGGFITGSKELIDWLRYFSRSHLFSVSLPPCNVAAVSKALDIFMADKTLAANLKRNIAHFSKGLREMGFPIPENHESAIVPAVIGDESKMGIMYQSLLDDGIWCVPIVYPAVSRKNCRFRFTVMATHSISDLDYALICLEKALIKTGSAIEPAPLAKKAA